MLDTTHDTGGWPRKKEFNLPSVAPMAKLAEITEETQRAQKKQNTSLPSMPAVCRLPPMDTYRRYTEGSHLRPAPNGPSARPLMHKPPPLPQFAGAASYTTMRYGLHHGSEKTGRHSPPGLSSRPSWRTLLDSPSSFGRDHETRFGSTGEPHRFVPRSPAYDPHAHRKHPYAEREASRVGWDAADAEARWLRNSADFRGYSPLVPPSHSLGQLRPGMQERTYAVLDMADADQHSKNARYSAREPMADPYSFRGAPQSAPARTWSGNDATYDGSRSVKAPYYTHKPSHAPHSGRYPYAAQRRTPSPDMAAAHHYSYASKMDMDLDRRHHTSTPMMTEDHVKEEMSSSTVPHNSNRMVAPIAKSAKCKTAPGGSASEAPVVHKRGGKLPKHITDMLKAWLLEHAEHPYPTEDEKRAFCEYTGLDICQISNWFVNARRRILAPQNARAAAATATE